MTAEPKDQKFAVRNLEVRFGPGDGVEVVSGVSLELHPGRMLALVGESGCGKSVTAAALGGILPRGMRVATADWSMPRTLGGGGLAYVFQEPATSLNPVLRVDAQIAEALAVAGVPRAQRRTETLDLLGQVGLAGEAARVAKSYPHQLSGGMQQRVMMAMALALRPKILVADEPTTALDVTVQRRILALLRDLMERRGLAVLLITHNLGIVAEVADAVSVMYAGRIVESGPVADVLAAPRHPYVQGLLRALPDLRAPSGRLSEMPGKVPPLGHRPPGCRFAPRCPLATPRCAAEPPPWTAPAPARGVACWEAGAKLDALENLETLDSPPPLRASASPREVSSRAPHPTPDTRLP